MTTTGRHRIRPGLPRWSAVARWSPAPQEDLHILRASTARQRWRARLAFAAAALAVLVVLVAAEIRSLGLLVVGAAGLALTAAGVWWVLTRRGVVRLLAGALVVGAPVAVALACIRAGLLWAVLVTAGLGLVAVVAGRAALAGDHRRTPMPEREVPPPARPWILMNPRSGGGKVASFGLRGKAEALGAEVTMLDGTGRVDELARKAVADGADLLGVAGGDGTQALVAAVAAEYDIPFLVISAGTRNHFALDLGLDRDDPSRCLDALTDGVELLVDLGVAGGKPFVNTASFGAYATIVEREDYRDEKISTALDVLPDILAHRTGPHLVAHAGGTTINGPQALLISNNPYGTGDLAGLGHRACLDSGALGVVGVTVDNAAQAASLLCGRHSRGLSVLCTRTAVVDADEPAVPVGVDGETLWLNTPVTCTVNHGVLRVRVPRYRPGVPAPTPRLNWRRLHALALSSGRPARAT